MFMRPPGIYSGNGDFKWERLRLFASTVLSSYDVVSVQECFAFGTTRRSEFIRLAKEQGLEYHCACPLPSWTSGQVDGGLLILSRFPITDTDYLTYPRGVHSDWLAAKGVLYARIEVAQGQYLMLFSTHTQASYEADPPLDSPSSLVRLDQLQRASKFISAKLDPIEPTNSQQAKGVVMFAGDFNVNGRFSRLDGVQHSKEYQLLVDTISGSQSIQDQQTPSEISKNTSQKELFDVVDIAYTCLNEHPVTTCTIVDTDKEPENKCLDYLFHLISKSTTPTSVQFKNVSVEPFLVDKQPFTHMSDHCGMAANLVFTQINPLDMPSK
ncbi:hypothetical protein BDEG_21566 [Batrachochytrium dendrobatidis JEL423]|nr:hypothetical protein BDEG_21566 [Batrachochytrium dendrobatidis JEL423]